MTTSGAVLLLAFLTVVNASTECKISSDKCTSGYRTNNGTDFRRCKFPLQCVSDKCEFEASTPSSGVPVGGYCNYTLDLYCANDGFCNASTCSRRTPDGTSCVTWQSCASDICYNGTCITGRTIGQSCASLPTGGDNCGSFKWGDYGTSLLCDHKICKVQVRAGQPCNATFMCRTSLSCASGECRGLPAGSPCMSDECDVGLYCSSNMFCTAMGHEGEACASDDACLDDTQCNVGKCTRLASVKEGGAADRAQFCEDPWNAVVDGHCKDANGLACHNDKECQDFDFPLSPFAICSCSTKVCSVSKKCKKNTQKMIRATSERAVDYTKPPPDDSGAMNDFLCCLEENSGPLKIDKHAFTKYIDLVFSQKLSCGLPLAAVIVLIVVACLIVVGGIVFTVCYCRRRKAQQHGLINQPLINGGISG